MSVTLEHSDDRVSTPTQTNVVVADTHTDDEPNVDEFDAEQFFDTENPNCECNDTNADHSTLTTEQSECPSLREYWKLAEQNRNGFFVEDGLSYHRDTILGHKVKQVYLPENAYP